MTFGEWCLAGGGWHLEGDGWRLEGGGWRVAGRRSAGGQNPVPSGLLARVQDRAIPCAGSVTHGGD